MEWRPVIDEDYMPSAPITEDGFADASFDVPLLIGSNIDEWAMAGLRRDATDEEKALFTKAYPNEPDSGADTVDTLIRLPMLKIMSHKADQGGANVYAYEIFRNIHMLSAYWGFVFMSIHIGTNVGVMTGMIKKTKAYNSKSGRFIFISVPILISCYGIYAFYKRLIWQYMFLVSHFVFFDYSEPLIFFMADYLSVMILYATLGHYLSKFLQSLSTRKA